MTGGQTGRWIDVSRLPQDVVAVIESLAPGEDLLVKRDGRPIATITGSIDPVDTGTPVESAAYDDVTVVATAMKLSPSARASLSDQLGPDYIVLDMNSAPESAEVLLIPPVSPQLIGIMRGKFPKARVVIAEVEDRELGITYQGPLGRLINAGADVYVPPSTIPRLAQQLDRAVTQLNQLTGDTPATPLVIEAGPLE